MSTKRSNLHIAEHPYLEHMLTLMRDEECPYGRFRQLVEDSFMFLAFKALRIKMPVQSTAEVRTPIGSTIRGNLFDSRRMAIVSVPRAGNIPARGLHRMFPAAPIVYIDMIREDDEGRPIPPRIVREKYPPDMDKRFCFIVEPSIATGDTALLVLRALERKNVARDNILFLNLVCAPDGILKISEEFPEVPIVSAAIDKSLSRDGRIIPGMGDVGDRLFLTDQTHRVEET